LHDAASFEPVAIHKLKPICASNWWSTTHSPLRNSKRAVVKNVTGAPKRRRENAMSADTPRPRTKRIHRSTLEKRIYPHFFE